MKSSGWMARDLSGNWIGLALPLSELAVPVCFPGQNLAESNVACI